MKTHRSRTGWLFEPVSNASLALYRVLFGLAACAVAAAAAWTEVAWWDYMITLPDVLTVGAFALVAAGGLGVALGWAYHASLAALMVGAGGALVVLGETVPGPFSAVALLASILLVVPAHRRWSVDVAVRPKRAGLDLPRWGVLLVQAQSVVVCGMAGMQFVSSLAPDALLPWLTTGSLTPAAVAGGGVMLGAVAGPALLRRRLGGVLLLAVAGLHLFAAAFAPTAVVAVLMAASATLFLPPDWPMRLAGRPESGWVRASRHTGGFTPVRFAAAILAALYFGFQLAAAAAHAGVTP